MTHPESNQPTPAVLYAAKSTEDRHDSIPDQLRECEAMAEREGWRVVGGFRDEGFSAYRGNRGPGLERAKRAAAQAAKEHGRCIIVASDSDRFARGCGDEPGSADHLFDVRGQLNRHGVEMWTCRLGRELDRMTAFIEGERSFGESDRKKHATRAGKRRRVERGDSSGPLQFGYRIVYDGRGQSRRVPDPDEAPVVRQMFAMLDEGRTLSEITRWLNGNKVKTKRGNPFGRSRVRGILTNPWYGGRMKAYGEVVPANHEPLLPWDEFERISAKLRRAKAAPGSRRRGGEPSEVALLSGLMQCAHCGHGIWHRNGKRRRYVCGHVRHATGACDAAPFDAKLTEEAVLDYLQDLFFDFEGWLRGVTEHRLEQRRGYERVLAGIEDERAKVDRRDAQKRRDYRNAEDGFASRAALDAIRELEEERERLDREEREVEAAMERDEQQSAADDMLDFWNDLSRSVREQVIGAGSVREANAALREMFAAVFVTSTTGDPPRLDFILRDREPGAPLVSASVWAVDPDDPDHAAIIPAWQHWEPEGQTVPSTLV